MVEQRRATRGGYDEGSASPFASGTLRLSEVPRYGDRNSAYPDSPYGSPREHKAQKPSRFLSWKVLLTIAGMVFIIVQATGTGETFWNLDATAASHKSGRGRGQHDADDWEQPFSVADPDEEDEETQPTATKHGNRPVEAKASAEARRVSDNTGREIRQENREAREQVPSDHAGESFKSSSGAVRGEDEDKSDTWPADSDWSPDGEEQQENPMDSRQKAVRKAENPKANMEDWSPDSKKESAEEEDEDNEVKEDAAIEHAGAREDSEELGSIHKGEQGDSRSDSLANAQVDEAERDETEHSLSNSHPSSDSFGAIHAEHAVAERDSSDSAPDQKVEEPADGTAVAARVEEPKDTIKSAESYAGSEDLPVARQTPPPRIETPIEAEASDEEAEGKASQDIGDSSDNVGSIVSQDTSHLNSHVEVGSIHTEADKNSNSNFNSDHDVDDSVDSDIGKAESGGMLSRNRVADDSNRAPEQYAGAEELPTIAETASVKQPTISDKPASITIKSNQESDNLEAAVGDVHGEGSEQKSQKKGSEMVGAADTSFGLEKAVSQQAATDKVVGDLGAVKAENSQSAGGVGDLGVVKAESPTISEQRASAGDLGAAKSHIAEAETSTRTTSILKVPAVADVGKATNSRAQATGEVGAVRSEAKTSDDVVGDVHTEGSGTTTATHDEILMTSSSTTTSTTSFVVTMKPKEVAKNPESVGAMSSEASMSTNAGAVGSVSLEKHADDSIPKVGIKGSSDSVDTPGTGTVKVEKPSQGFVSDGVGSVKSETVASSSAVSGSIVSEITADTTTTLSGHITSTSSLLLFTTTTTAHANSEVGAIMSGFASVVGAVTSEVGAVFAPQASEARSSTTSRTALSQHSTTTTTTITTTTTSVSGASVSIAQADVKGVGTVTEEIGAIHMEKKETSSQSSLRGSAVDPKIKVAT